MCIPFFVIYQCSPHVDVFYLPTCVHTCAYTHVCRLATPHTCTYALHSWVHVHVFAHTHTPMCAIHPCVPTSYSTHVHAHPCVPTSYSTHCGVASRHTWVYVCVRIRTRGCMYVCRVATPYMCKCMGVHTCVKSTCLAHIMYIHHTPIYVDVHVCRDRHMYMYAEE